MDTLKSPPPLDLLETVQIIEYYNDILRRFFKDLDDRNRADTWETYAGLLSEEGGAGLVIFSDDGYVHPHYKVYFHHAPAEGKMSETEVNLPNT